MAALPRRFRVWPRDNVIGRFRYAAYAEGVQFTDGSIALRYTKSGVPASVMYPAEGIDAIIAGLGFGGEADIEWLDGMHG